jgi:hypothetical protein
MIDVFNVTGANVAAFGGRGFRLLADGESLPAGEVAFGVLALDNTTFVATVDNEIGDTSLSTTLFAGIMAYGTFTAVTVGGGRLMCYLK